jgi:hypothetical protein
MQTDAPDPYREVGMDHKFVDTEFPFRIDNDSWNEFVKRWNAYPKLVKALRYRHDLGLLDPQESQLLKELGELQC